MHMNHYQALAARTMNPALDKTESQLHALHGLAAEVGEIHGIIQKCYQGHQASEEHMKKEFGDCLWMIAEYCTASGWTLDEIAHLNIEKLKARYPEGFQAEKSLHRKEGDI